MEKTFTKGQRLFTLNALGEMVACQYDQVVPKQEDCHTVKIIEGVYQGTCYKGIAELFTEKPVEEKQNIL